jgi:hypothetical protein
VRVNITYSVDLEGVPKEVQELLSKEADILCILKDKLASPPIDNPLECVESLNDVRAVIARLDVRLTECVAMLSGYIDLISQPTSTPHTQEDQLEISDD